MAKLFDPDIHEQRMSESEEYRKGYQYAAECIDRMKITPENIKKMAFIFLEFKQPNAAGMAYCYWERGNALTAA
ncbi:hypothetical protein SOV_51220 [Sporomusa ovata DSM 2662]|uniref:Uncharacterized protein n=1 Tax=Sporomusa ovata TaxID=2378 RepID=A0A0U1L1X9_9FIRM|nr:hypothetical protein [Sporomusa ovata]EQB27495.1 hypothetical protein SOV_2c03910 [Sporomusa ovata DSM 2662]CQR73339.1 hypothetical protein SpAn4DRAFT_2571 [Sporomusa ovata]